jgi:hypothetical protein
MVTPLVLQICLEGFTNVERWPASHFIAPPPLPRRCPRRERRAGPTTASRHSLCEGCQHTSVVPLFYIERPLVSLLHMRCSQIQNFSCFPGNPHLYCIPSKWHLTESSWNCATAAQGTRSIVSSRRARHRHLEAQPLVLLTATTACRTVPSRASLLAARCLPPASWQLSAQVGAGKAMYCPCSRDCTSNTLRTRVLRMY